MTEEGKTIKELKVHIDEARNAGAPLPFKDKIRGRLVSGRFGEKNVFVIGTPYHISVAAVSLDGTQLWNYFTTRVKGPTSGVNDIQIGALGGKPMVVVGCSDGSVHLIDESGRKLDSWDYEISVTNVACGKIKGKDAVAVGLYNGSIFTYIVEPTLAQVETSEWKNPKTTGLQRLQVVNPKLTSPQTQSEQRVQRPK